MRKISLLIMFLMIFALNVQAQDDLAFETVTIAANDDLMLVGDLYLPETSDDSTVPAVLLLHMVGGHRGAYDPLIPDLIEAGYATVAVDIRGHGDTRGSQDWGLAIDDVQVWLDWLREQESIDGEKIVIIGASIGSNIGLIGCANDDLCVGAVALSPGLDYYGVEPESAVVEGLAERSVLLVASHRDVFSAESIEQMFMNSTGDVGARMYQGAAHGTNFFRTDDERITHLILSWLSEHFAEEIE